MQYVIINVFLSNSRCFYKIEQNIKTCMKQIIGTCTKNISYRKKDKRKLKYVSYFEDKFM